MSKLKQFLKRIPYWLKFAVEFMILYWTIFYAHDLFFTGHDNYLSMVLALFVFPVAFLVYDLPPWIKIIAYFLDLLVLGSIIGLIIQIIKSKIKKITTKTMNNNQTQSTNQPNPNRFHLKTWQWVSVLAVVAAIVGGVFAFFGLKERPSNGEPLRICSQNSDCYFTCDYGCINKAFKHEDKSLCNMPGGSCKCIKNECQFVEVISENLSESLIKDAIQQANYCQTADDCMALGDYCSFSSWQTYVNRKEKEKIQSMIEDFNKNTNLIINCKPSVCNNISPAQCVGGKCYVECLGNPQAGLPIITSVREIIENPQKFAETNVRVGGEIHTSQLMYSGTEGQAGGAIMNVSLYDNESSVGLSLSIKDITGKWYKESEEFKTKYNGKKVVVEGRVEWSGGYYHPSIVVRDIKHIPETIALAVTITTDKTEYEQGETVETTVFNGLDFSVYTDSWKGSWNILQHQGDKWNNFYSGRQRTLPTCLCDNNPDGNCPQREAPEESFDEIQPSESVDWSWSQKKLQGTEKGCFNWIDAPPGKYKVEFRHFYILDPNEREWKRVYSNEFEIKEKIADHASKQKCAKYTRNGIFEEHCAICGNRICEPFETCVSSSVSGNHSTTDCGGLYCPPDCP